jgi:hypothetical protein
MLMIRVGVLASVLLMAGCGSSSSGSSTPSLYQTWEDLSANGENGQFLVFSQSGGYVHSILATTSSANVFDAEIEQGTFTISGQTMTLTPTQWTCTGAYAPYTATFNISGQTLEFVVNGAILGLQPDTATAGQGTLVEGCFGSTGGFTQQALAPVSP